LSCLSHSFDILIIVMRMRSREIPFFFAICVASSTDPVFSLLCPSLESNTTYSIDFRCFFHRVEFAISPAKPSPSIQTSYRL
jgi:hypothetical protein